MYPSIHSVWFTHRDADSILVDIPIGLPESQRHDCDARAKEFVDTEQANSVFWTPCREAVEADMYEKEKEANEACRGDSLSSQAWGLIPRIQEVDRLLRDDEQAREIIRESYPEVCFTALNDGDSLASKHGDTRQQERNRCLKAVDDSIIGVYDGFESEYIDDQPAWARCVGSSNGDRLLDAMALAVTAKRGADGFKTLPEEPREDSENLSMEIVYARP